MPTTGARTARANNSIMDELDGAHIHAARRLGRNQNARFPLKFPRYNELLLVPAGKLSRQQRQVPRPDIVLLDGLRGFQRALQEGDTQAIAAFFETAKQRRDAWAR